MFKNETYQAEGLLYNYEILGKLVNQDSDLDGVLDWEESLWGTDPRKRDTDDNGVPDNKEIENLKIEESKNQPGETLVEADDENLTETDKFSREFFATVATLSQNGEIDQATIEKLSESLAEQIKNRAPRKVFLYSELKIEKSASLEALVAYNNALRTIYAKYPSDEEIEDVFAQSVENREEGEINTGTLDKLDPIIKKIRDVANTMMATKVPEDLALFHLAVANGFEKLAENLADIKLVDTDVIVALGAMGQYENNVVELQDAIDELALAIKGEN